MRITLISGYFYEGRGYQENIWPQYLHMEGHEVLVLCGDHKDGLRGASPTSDGNGYAVRRLPALYLPAGIILSSRVSDALAQFRPDAALWIGVGQFFGLPLLFDKRSAQVRLASFFGENLGMHEFDWTKRELSLQQRFRAVGFWVLRGGFYRRVFRRSTLIVATKHQTAHILYRLCRSTAELEAFRAKLLELPLGFDPRVFKVDIQAGRAVRSKYRVRDEDILIAVSSRFSRGKHLDLLVRDLSSALDADQRLKVVLIGFATADPISEALRRQINASPYAARFIQQPFMPRHSLAAWFNAADIGLFHNPSISVQEAMGTGLFMCLADDGSMAHLISSPKHGLFFEKGSPDSLVRCLRAAADRITRQRQENEASWREAIRRDHTWLGYDHLAAELLARLRSNDAHRSHRL